MSCRTVQWAIGGLLVVLLCAALEAQTIRWLPVPPGWSDAVPYDLTPDGQVVVGIARDSYRRPRAVMWTASGMLDLGGAIDNRSHAFGVSADGTVVVGGTGFSSYYVENRYRQAFRWTPTDGMRLLGTLGGSDSTALDVSADGEVVVGIAYTRQGQRHAFRWTPQTGMQDLGSLSISAGSEALGVSANGSVVVGTTATPTGSWEAFRWTPETGMMRLGSLGGSFGEATAVSADGRVAVGRSQNARGVYRAFRWSADSGIRDLGDLGGERSEAYGVSGDGSVIVGRSRNTNLSWRAFRWSEMKGLEDLTVAYSAILRGKVLYEARAISPDGRYIVGWGDDGPYILDTIPEPTTLGLFTLGLIAIARYRRREEKGGA